ncbi:hypothetical protein HY992_05675 [Candidatus Micrarchaeota archaeon]|nr:hypothetical protein [Candidatus Micrarchaeota archaeon]
MTGPRTAQKTVAQTSRQTTRTTRTRPPQRSAQAAATATKAAAKKRPSKAKPAKQAKKAIRLRYASILKHNVDAIIVFKIEDPRSPRRVGRDVRFDCRVADFPREEAVAKKAVTINLLDVDVIAFSEAVHEAFRLAGEAESKSVAFMGGQLAELSESIRPVDYMFDAIARSLAGQEAVRRVDIVCPTTEMYAALNNALTLAKKAGKLADVPLRLQFNATALAVYGELDGWGKA